MNVSAAQLVTAGGFGAAMAAYALFAGADFGGGIWDLLAGGTARGRAPRSAIDKSVTPAAGARSVAGERAAPAVAAVLSAAGFELVRDLVHNRGRSR